MTAILKEIERAIRAGDFGAAAALASRSEAKCDAPRDSGEAALYLQELQSLRKLAICHRAHLHVRFAQLQPALGYAAMEGPREQGWSTQG